MTCNDCLYYEICKDYLIKCAEHGEAERTNNPCVKFKNKANFVELVKCKDCTQHDNCYFEDTFKGVGLAEEHRYCGIRKRK